MFSNSFLKKTTKRLSHVQYRFELAKTTKRIYTDTNYEFIKINKINKEVK